MDDLATSQERADQIAELVKAIAHPVRLRIIAILCRGDERVSDLAKRLGKNQSAVSQQLRILRMSGLVTTVRENGAGRYSLAEPRLRELVNCLEGCHRQAAPTGSTRSRLDFHEG